MIDVTSTHRRFVATTILRGLVRTLATVFCWSTALYAFIASSSFAYLQFIKPRVFGWVGTFADAHQTLVWAWLAMVCVLAMPHLRVTTRRSGGSRATNSNDGSSAENIRRSLAVGLCLFSAALAIGSSVWNLVPSLEDDGLSVTAGVLSLVPMLWLALLDHLEGSAALHQREAVLSGRPGVNRADARSDSGLEVGASAVGAGTKSTSKADALAASHEGRLLIASLATACVVTVAYAVLGSLSIARAFEPDLRTYGLALGVGASLLGHLLVFSAVFVVLAVSCRISRVVAVQYSMLLVIATLLFAGLFARFVGDSIGMIGWRSQFAAFVAGLTIAATWGGTRLASYVRRGEQVAFGVDVFFSPALDMAASSPASDRARGWTSQQMSLVVVGSILPLAWLFVLAASRIDWDFALLKSGVVIVWLMAFALVYRASSIRAVPTTMLLVASGLPLAAHAVWHPSESQLHALERYAVHNPSWLLTDGLLHERNQSRPFDRYLRANTGLTDITVAPVPIDLVDGPMAPVAEKPSIFLFVVDSLRADYLSPYNPEVQFTPNIAAFASENVFFPNAFTRYGGTGLSMPAIWAGSALAHKQYVTPFDSMNALQRLVDLNGYRRIQTRDHITDALWTHRPDDIELDRGRGEMDFDFCRTLEELGQQLDQNAVRDKPVFAQTRSLNLHVAAVRNGYVPPDKHYPKTFEAPYAYRVERIDGCFGSFVERLKRLRLYDRSIVVLTADHGELIGEDGRWGHSYHMFPQVIQVPLFLHLPKEPHRVSFDRDAAALTTDITPTIYEALGYQVRQSSSLTGLPLISSAGGALATTSDDANSGAMTDKGRRRRFSVSSASYGAVYAVVSHNGRRLFIADAIQEDQRAYRRESLHDLRWTEVPVDQGTRMLAELRIRRFVDEIARTYTFDRPF